VSKQRPSSAASAPIQTTEALSALADAWQQRVFRNTYTRRGRRIKVRRWSVKIQHQGIRRTVSLAAETRADAAIEAQAIYQTIVTQGWEAVRRAPRMQDAAGGGIEADRLSKTDVRYWKRRLLLRRHPLSLNPPGSAELSVRIEHAGASCYFPLATLNEDLAAARAREIYRVVVKQGWEAAGRVFPRELTIALHWAENPLAWTYATFHTSIGGAPQLSTSSVPGKGRRIRYIILEPIGSLRQTLPRVI